MLMPLLLIYEEFNLAGNHLQWSRTCITIGVYAEKRALISLNIHPSVYCVLCILIIFVSGRHGVSGKVGG